MTKNARVSDGISVTKWLDQSSGYIGTYLICHRTYCWVFLCYNAFQGYHKFCQCTWDLNVISEDGFHVVSGHLIGGI